MSRVQNIDRANHKRLLDGNVQRGTAAKALDQRVIGEIDGELRNRIGHKNLAPLDHLRCPGTLGHRLGAGHGVRARMRGIDAPRKTRGAIKDSHREQPPPCLRMQGAEHLIGGRR